MKFNINSSIIEFNFLHEKKDSFMLEFHILGYGFTIHSVTEKELESKDDFESQEVIKWLSAHFEKNDNGHWKLKVDPEKFRRVYLRGKKEDLTLNEIGIKLGMSGSSVRKYARQLKLGN